ncbi:hypothetical protein D3C72_2022290 [compost metagenome]
MQKDSQKTFDVVRFLHELFGITNFSFVIRMGRDRAEKDKTEKIDHTFYVKIGMIANNVGADVMMI